MKNVTSLTELGTHKTIYLKKDFNNLLIYTDKIPLIFFYNSWYSSMLALEKSSLFLGIKITSGPLKDYVNYVN